MSTTLAEAVDAFYAAGNRMLQGDLSAFEAIWSEADDITDLGPTSAIHTGRAAVMAEFAREGAMNFRGTLRAEDRHLVESGNLSYLVCVERTSGMSQAGEPIAVDIRSTTVFRKEKGHWRAVHHHTDRF